MSTETNQTDEEFNKVWKEEYQKRSDMVKGLTVEWDVRSRMATLKIRGKKEMLEQLRPTFDKSGDTFTLLLSNMNIKNTQISYAGRVKPYKVEENQQTLDP